MRVDALVLAGGGSRNLGEHQDVAKALIKISDRPMVEFVVNTLKKCESVDRIAVVAPSIAHTNSWVKDADIFINAVGTITENMSLGLRALNSPYPVLIVSSDIPLISPEAIEDFINRCEKESADIFYPIISKKTVEATFPGVKRTYAFLREGIFTGGNIGLVNAQVILQNMETIEKAYHLRKSPVKLLRILGLRFVLKFLFRYLTVAELEEAVSRLLNSKSKAVVTPYPQIGVDVDKISDLSLVRKILSDDKEV